MTDLWKLLGTNRTMSALHKLRFDVSPGTADSGSFLLPGTLVVLWRKTSPGAKMLRGGKHGHIHSNFRDNADSGKRLDPRRRHNKVELRKIYLSSCQNQRLQIKFTQVEAIHVGTDDAELFSLFGTHFSIHGGLNLLNGLLDVFSKIGLYVKRFIAF